MSKSLPLREKIANELREAIVKGVYQAKQRLREVDLSSRLSVSRTPLREALFSLCEEGLVQWEHDRGFSVAPLSSEEIREIYPMIWALEMLALDLSRRTVSSLCASLTKLNTQFKKSKDREIAVELDTAWHQLLISKCGNRTLLKSLEEYRARVRRYEIFFMEDVAQVTASADQHQEIIDALEKLNISKAQQLLENNWRCGMEQLLVNISFDSSLKIFSAG